VTIEAKAVLVLCGPCVDKLDEDKNWLHAKFGPQGLGPDDVAVLVASRMIDLRDVRELPNLTKLNCEHCDATIYAAPSSHWLLDLKRRLNA